jgi:hypothetical protein
MTVVLTTAAVALASIVPGGVAPRHGGGETVTSNYRTEITDIAPPVKGLHVGLADIGGTLELTWNGAGTLVVEGYEGEPYLRITPDGVDRNLRSPATYLNRDRYASTTPPATADAAAPPEWEHISDEPTVRWHDHRTHWMDRIPPAEVLSHRDRTTVIFPRWEVPMSVDGTSVVVAGRLQWVPPPHPLPWIVAAVLIAVASALTLVVAGRARATTLLGLTGFAAILFAVDSGSYLATATRGASAWAWYVVWPALVVVAAILATLRRARDSGLGILAAAGLLVAVFGGLDRLDAVNHSQVFAALPDWWSRLSAVACLSIGATVAVAVIALLASHLRQPIS